MKKKRTDKKNIYLSRRINRNRYSEFDILIETWTRNCGGQYQGSHDYTSRDGNIKAQDCKKPTIEFSSTGTIATTENIHSIQLPMF